MIRKLIDFIIRITNLRTLALAVLLMIIFEAAFGFFMHDFTEKTGGPLLDMSVGYNSDYAYQRLESFSLAGETYLSIRAIDFFFPAVYAFAFSILSAFVYKRKYTESANYRWVLLVPFIAAVFDYTENIILVTLYRSLPVQYPVAAAACNIAGILKFGLIGLSILLFITGGFSLLKGGDSMLIMGNKFKGQKKDSNSEQQGSE